MSGMWIPWLKDRYARGEIEVEEFEASVEAALEGQEPNGYAAWRGRQFDARVLNLRAELRSYEEAGGGDRRAWLAAIYMAVAALACALMPVLGWLLTL